MSSTAAAPRGKPVYGRGASQQDGRDVWAVIGGTNPRYPIVLDLLDGEALDLSTAAARSLRDALDRAIRAQPG